MKNNYKEEFKNAFMKADNPFKNKPLHPAWKWMGFYFTGVTIFTLGAVLILTEILFKPEPIKTTYIYVWNIPIISWIPSMLLICIGIAWVLHGFKIRLLA